MFLSKINAVIASGIRPIHFYWARFELDEYYLHREIYEYAYLIFGSEFGAMGIFA